MQTDNTKERRKTLLLHYCRFACHRVLKFKFLVSVCLITERNVLIPVQTQFLAVFNVSFFFNQPSNYTLLIRKTFIFKLHQLTFTLIQFDFEFILINWFNSAFKMKSPVSVIITSDVFFIFIISVFYFSKFYFNYITNEWPILFYFLSLQTVGQSFRSLLEICL